MSAVVERRERAARRAEDMAISIDLILRSVPAIDALIVALEGAGAAQRLVKALRRELAKRRRRR